MSPYVCRLLALAGDIFKRKVTRGLVVHKQR